VHWTPRKPLTTIGDSPAPLHPIPLDFHHIMKGRAYKDYYPGFGENEIFFSAME